jgi:hypothetical protein
MGKLHGFVDFPVDESVSTIHDPIGDGLGVFIR